MNTAGTWYYPPCAGTGNLLLANPPFIMDTNQPKPQRITMSESTSAPDLLPEDPVSAFLNGIEYLKQHTFHVGDVLMSPNCYRFEVIHVSPEGIATLTKQGPGWSREVRMAWNSPKLLRWTWLERR